MVINKVKVPAIPHFSMLLFWHQGPHFDLTNPACLKLNHDSSQRLQLNPTSKKNLPVWVDFRPAAHRFKYADNISNNVLKVYLWGLSLYLKNIKIK